MTQKRPCKRCAASSAIGPRALNNSDWCRACWQSWWKSVEVHGELARIRAGQKHTDPPIER